MRAGLVFRASGALCSKFTSFICENGWSADAVASAKAEQMQGLGKALPNKIPWGAN